MVSKSGDKRHMEALWPLAGPSQMFRKGGVKMLDRGRLGSILVVDDEETIGIGISEILRDEGFEVAYVISGLDAIEAVRERSYNLVFMDIVMPGMNGLEAFREIKKERPATRVVLFTGYFRDAEDVILQGIKEGYFADDIIKSARKYA